MYLKAVLLTATLGLLANAGATRCKRSPIDFFIDFDGTIAIDDSLEALANAAYASVPESTLKEFGIPDWSYFSDAYYQDYDAFSKTQPPRKTLDDELAYRTSPGLREVEAASYDRVQASGLFNLITESSLTSAASKVAIRPGFKAFVAASQAAGIKLQIISVNWSPKWIRKVLEHHVGEKLADKIAIYCAEIIPGDIAGPPHKLDFDRRLHTGDDKIKLIRKLRKHSRKRSVYIGDSKTDLPALIDAGVGIVTDGDGSLLSSMETWGMEKWDLTRTNLRKHKSGKSGLFYLEDYEEVITSGLLR